MKFLKYMFILIFLLGFGFSIWVVYPHYQISKFQEKSMEVGKELSKETYLDYYRQSKKKDIQHLAIGDSIIHGFGVGETENFVYKFSNQLGEEIDKTVHYTNKGVNGLTSTKLNELVQAGQLDEDIKKSDIITINIGGNDVLKTARKQDYYAAAKSFDTLQSIFSKNLTEITNRIKRINPNITIILLELYNPLPEGHQLAELADSLLPKWNVKIYEVASNFPSSIVVQTTKVINSENPQNLSHDGVHPSSAGYAAITEQILEQFAKEYRRQAI